MVAGCHLVFPQTRLCVDYVTYGGAYAHVTDLICRRLERWSEQTHGIRLFRWQCRERVRLCVVDPHLHAVSSFRLRPDMLSAWLSHLLVTSKAEAYHSVVQAVCP